MSGAGMQTPSPAGVAPSGAPPNAHPSHAGRSPAASLQPQSQSQPHHHHQLPSSLSLGLLPLPPSSSRPPPDHYNAIGPEPIASAYPAAGEHPAAPIPRVRLADIAPYDGAPCGAYAKAVEALSGSLARHNAVVIELGGEDSTMVRCSLESARMYFKAKAQCSGVGGGMDSWRKSNRGVYMYRAGRALEDGDLSPPCMSDAFKCLGKAARVALCAVARHLRLRSDVFNHLLDDSPLPPNEVSSSVLVATFSHNSPSNGKGGMGGVKPGGSEVEKGLLTLIASDNTGIQVCDPNGHWYLADGASGPVENRAVAALVSLLVSQALLLFSTVPSGAGADSGGGPNPTTLLILHLLSSYEVASAAPLLLHRKRKRGSEGRPAVAAAPISVRRQPDHFRLGLGMGASTFEWLAGLLEPLLDSPTGGGPGRLPAAARLALGLSHLATGAPYPDLAARFGVPEPAVRSCSRRLRRVLCTNFRFWLAFPPRADLPSVSAAFGSLPGCCGAIACARFDAGGGVTAQVLADASCRILNIAAGFRGDQPESRVLRRSSLYRDGEAGRLLGSPDQYLVGGAGYPLLPWLMVPFKDAAANSPEEAFNAAHRLMRRPVLRTISSLRNWGILCSPMEGEEDGRAVAACVATCAILHNVLLMREDYSALAADQEEEEEAKECLVDGGKYQEDEVLMESSGEEKALALRNALAEKAREIHCHSSASEQC